MDIFSFKDAKDILKEDYFLFGKKDITNVEYEKLKMLTVKPYFKTVLERYKQCFGAMFFIFKTFFRCCTIGLLLHICALLFVIFMFFTAPFLHLVYKHWRKKFEKKK